MAYTFNCTECHQRDYELKCWMEKLRAFENAEDKDDIQNGLEVVRVREACLSCEDNFDLLDDEGKEEKKVEEIEAERDARALIPEGDEYWSWLSAQPRKKPAKPYCYLTAVFKKHDEGKRNEEEGED